MTVQELIAKTERLGGKFILDGERIRFRVPNIPDVLRLVEELRANREEVLAALRERDKAQLDWLLKWEPKGLMQ